MFKKIQEIVRSFFEGHERTVKAKKNIAASVIIRGLSMVVGFLMVRVTLDYLDQTTYGIWLTLTSFLTWFSFFEIGLGNGLRNKLAEALAVEDYELGKSYVSTTYAILGAIMFVLCLLFFFGNSFLDWSVILNTDKKLASELSNLALIVFGFFFLTFVFQLITIVLSADQRPAIGNSFGPIGNLIVLIIIYILTLTTEGSLIYLGWVLSAVPFLVLVVATIYFYMKDYKHISPSFKYVKLKYAKDLLNLGVKFFAIQIAGLIIYQSTTIIIAQYFGPAEVTIYNIAYKYFSILTMAFTIIVTPFWSAFTEAWVKKDTVWIKNTINKLIKIWMALTIVGVIMLLVAEQFYYIWIGDEEIIIPFNLSAVLLIYFVTYTFGGIFNMFINGVGKIRLQLVLATISAFIFVGVAILLIEVFELGIISLVIASIIANIEGFVIAPIQYKKIINNRAYGIWNK